MEQSEERRREQRLRYHWPVWFAEDFNRTLTQGQMVDGMYRSPVRPGGQGGTRSEFTSRDIPVGGGIGGTFRAVDRGMLDPNWRRNQIDRGTRRVGEGGRRMTVEQDAAASAAAVPQRQYASQTSTGGANTGGANVGTDDRKPPQQLGPPVKDDREPLTKPVSSYVRS